MSYEEKIAAAQAKINAFKEKMAIVAEKTKAVHAMRKEEIAEAIDSINAESVFVLPNNSNIILAAQQAAELTEKTVYVVPTKSVPMGISAAVAFCRTPSIS